MALPILQNIADTVKTRLQAITTANGYEFNAVSVEYASRDTNTWNPAPRKIYIEQMDAVENDELSHPGNPPAQAYDVVFEITGFSHQLDVDTEVPGVDDTGTTENQVMAAMQKAVTAGGAAVWQSFGGNAINATIEQGVQIDGVGHGGAKVTLIVTYRISEIDPYTVRA